ncbi:transposase [Hymenobacter sp. BRD128]|uniref:transposase n=1 Tax=Hymenobacter sp. BRD128 TaxID=2675878 RepID=UPI0015677597|nr:transposase [Hymenobacter sp. BRD128]
MNGIFCVLRNGCAWPDVPAGLPPWGTVYHYFTKWSAAGTWERISGCLSIAARERAKKRATHGSYPRQPKREKHGYQYGPHGLRRR